MFYKFLGGFPNIKLFNERVSEVAYTLVSQRVQPNPLPGSAAVGECHRNFHIFRRIKRVRLPAQVSKFHGQLHTSHMAANVGLKTQ